MYCKNCNTLLNENTTVCHVCGTSLYSYNTIKCSHCGQPANYKSVNKLKLKLIDWFIIIAFFPLSIFYFIAIKPLRTETYDKCSHCNHIEKT